MKRTALIVTIVAALTVAAQASAANTDPRVCHLTRATPAATKHDCAEAAALLIFRRSLSARANMRIIWQGPVDCFAQRSFLKWRCTFQPRDYAPGAGLVSWKAPAFRPAVVFGPAALASLAKLKAAG